MHRLLSSSLWLVVLLPCCTSTNPNDGSLALPTDAADGASDLGLTDTPDGAVESDAATDALPPTDATGDAEVAQPGPRKVDFLWVIDHSSSMCQEQRALAKGIDQFVAGLQAQGTIDAQMAVVTVQQIADLGGPTVATNQVKHVGQFMHAAATSFPPNCMERVRIPCSSDDTCAQASVTHLFSPLGPSSMCPASGTTTMANPLGAVPGWKCNKPSTVQKLTNQNCSINSYCEKRCTSDTECRELFEPTVPVAERRSICYVPGGTTPEQAGCMFPPDTQDCPAPDQLPAVLKSNPVDAAGQPAGKSNLDYFKCLATLGAGTSTESKFEGGLRSAWHALDPNGPNCPKDGSGQPTADCQNRQLLRDDADLVLVFVSDDDDCSVDLGVELPNLNAADKKANLAFVSTEDRDHCNLLGDAAGANQGLNEGNCEFRKVTDPSLTCLSDCVGLPLGSQQHQTCVTAAEVAVGASVKKDARFAPVAVFVDKFRSLKADPSRVRVAVVTGDSLYQGGATAAATEWQKRVDIAQFYRAAMKDTAPGQAPYVCGGRRGESAFGARYLELARLFGDNGFVQNICKSEAFTDGLTSMAAWVVAQATP
ncbi:MAG: hypothetical protein ACOYOB_10365 [Myxococcota bacterium]